MTLFMCTKFDNNRKLNKAIKENYKGKTLNDTIYNITNNLDLHVYKFYDSPSIYVGKIVENTDDEAVVKLSDDTESEIKNLLSDNSVETELFILDTDNWLYR